MLSVAFIGTTFSIVLITSYGIVCVLDVIFQFCGIHKLNSIHVHCIGMEAEIPQVTNRG